MTRTLLLVIAVGISVSSLPSEAGAQGRLPSFSVTLSAKIAPHKASGRLFIMLSTKSEPEVRKQEWWIGASEFCGMDISELAPGETVSLTDAASCYPFKDIREVPRGRYFAQAYLVVYRDYHRADGHTVWAFNQWDTHELGNAPGDLFSAVASVDLNEVDSAGTQFVLSAVVADRDPPRDTPWIKYVRIKSNLLSRFWGRPIYLGAVVLLPRGYDESQSLRYPVIYEQQILYDPSFPTTPFDFKTEPSSETKDAREARLANGYETGYEFSLAWTSPDFPKVVAVKLQHPTPYVTTSMVTNSAGSGPFADAITTELMPYIEKRFRIVGESSSRALVGKSAGGYDALTLQLHHPGLFGGGAWIYYPWPFEFSHFFTVDIYRNKSAYDTEPEDVLNDYRGPWGPGTERILGRTQDGQPMVTMRKFNHFAWAATQKWPGDDNGCFDDALSPVNAEGYPRPMFDRSSGMIDPAVAASWRRNGDLLQFTKDNWTTLAPRLAGKLHFAVGLSDEYTRYSAVREFQKFVESAQPNIGAEFVYGAFKGNGWQPMTNAQLVREIARRMRQAGAEGGAT